MDSERQTPNKIVMYLGGGAMAGIFGGGVLDALNEHGFQKNVEAIYSVSAGALNGAYFLTGETKKGASIYLEDLPGRFIYLSRIPVGIIQLFWNRYVRNLNPDGSIYNVVDIDFLFHVVRNVKPFNAAKLVEEGRDFYIKLLNIETGDCEYLNIADGDPLAILQAAVSVKPYYFSFQTIGGKKYIDGGIKEQFGIRDLLEKYPRHKIVAIFNEPITWRFKYYIKNFLEGLVSALYSYNAPLFKFFLHRESILRDDLKIALNDSRVLVVYCPKRNGILQIAKDSRRLLEHYRMGREAASKIIDFCKNDQSSY